MYRNSRTKGGTETRIEGGHTGRKEVGATIKTKQSIGRKKKKTKNA